MTGRSVTDNFIHELSEIKRQVQILVDERKPQQDRPPMLRQHLGYVGTTAITARSGTTPGTGTVTLKQINDTPAIADITDGNGTAIEVDVYNYSATASGASVYVWVGQDSRGTWFYLNEDCS